MAGARMALEHTAPEKRAPQLRAAPMARRGSGREDAAGPCRAGLWRYIAVLPLRADGGGTRASHHPGSTANVDETAPQPAARRPDRGAGRHVAAVRSALPA